MNKKTLLSFIFSFLITFIAIYVLWMIENQNKEIEFYAVIVNASKQSYLVKPFSNEKIISGYQEISITLDEGLKLGDIVKIKAENEILETYPPILDVISYELIYSLDNLKSSEIPTLPQDIPVIENENLS
ncbi:MAG: hypothetical protein WCR93_03815 [Bacilli bacterium]